MESEVVLFPGLNITWVVEHNMLHMMEMTGIQDGVNHDLAIITEWLKANKLSLNIKRHITCVFQEKK